MLTFERRGEGWGEELLPRAQFKRLPISRKRKSRRESSPRSLASSAAQSTSSAAATPSSQPPRASPPSRPSTSSSPSVSPSSLRHSRRADAAAAELERLLRDPEVAGLSSEEASAVVSAATSWRVTPAGRALRDRASVDRASRRAEAVFAYLRDECGLPPRERRRGRCSEGRPSRPALQARPTRPVGPEVRAARGLRRQARTP